LSATPEGSPQDGFRDRAKLLQSAIPAPIVHSRPGLEAMDADCRECKLERELGASNKDARTPVLRAEGESPFGRREPVVRSAKLK